jgi:hypothetical protein
MIISQHARNNYLCLLPKNISINIVGGVHSLSNTHTPHELGGRAIPLAQQGSQNSQKPDPKNAVQPAGITLNHRVSQLGLKLLW